MGQPSRTAAEQWVVDLPAPAVDGHEPWPVLSFTPDSRALVAHGQTQWTALDALPTGKDAAKQRLPRTLPAGVAPVPVPALAPTTRGRTAVPARPIAVARTNAGPPAFPPRVLRHATPPAYPQPMMARTPIRGRIPEAPKKSLGAWAFLALVLGTASLAPLFWQDAPTQWVPLTALVALFCSMMVFSRAQRGITPHGTISAARWGCGFALIATALWIIGILLVMGQLGTG